MLSDRRQIILRALIEEYIDCAMPVGSKTLVDNYDIHVSSATVRNDLSYLEDVGYIMQPHTSAGRIPTEAGYREFVDRVLDEFEDDEKTSDYVEIEEQVRKSASEIDELLDSLSKELAKLTSCLSVISPKTTADSNSHITKRGISSIMRQPEFRDSSALLPVMEIFEDDSVLFRTLSATSGDEEIAVHIGHENESNNLSGVSVVSATFGRLEDGGVVAVIGPTRMNYENVIKAVSMAQNILNDL